MLQLFGLFLLALSPIMFLVFALTKLKWEAYKAAFSAFVIATVLSLSVWQQTLINTATAALEGIALALWPIVIVIIAAVFTYNLTVHTGAMETIKSMLTSVSADKRVLALLIAWCFGGFLEGMAGFGTAVAIPASMLVALGFAPEIAILSCLLANGVPTMFGSIGIPTTTLASITGLDATRLAVTQALQATPFIIATPILITMLVGGGVKGLKGALPITLISGITMAGVEILAAEFIGPDLPVVVASVVSLIVSFVVALKSPQTQESTYLIPTNDDAQNVERVTPAVAAKAWLPFILIFVVLIMTSKLIPAINTPLSAYKTVAHIYLGKPDATLTFSWINTPGVLILLCGIIGGFAQGATPKEMVQVFCTTVKQMTKTIVTMLCVLAAAKIMGYSGMIASIAAFFVAELGSFYPLVAPLLGGLGTFVTGSGTSSEVLFGIVQQHAAESIHADPYWLCSANSLGVSFGKMISPQNIAIGTASCGLLGQDGKILGKISKYSLGYAVAMSLYVLAGTMLGI